ncbi:MAG: hypothetical protein A2048_08965 [Deltaproteobacteria bacterium GWA2_45_12]|nr:MAG: hypothetical protein A2048_08965 [Deltaproteobacteria bacterium GWA2_45_12]
MYVRANLVFALDMGEHEVHHQGYLMIHNSKIVFLWDIDGTLLLTGGAGQAVFDRLFEEFYGEKYIWENIHPDGRTDDAIIEELFANRFGKKPGKAELKKISDRYNELMGEEILKAHRFRLMPKAVETIKILSRIPHAILGLATGNYEISARHKLKKAGLNDYFSFGGFGSDSHCRFELTRLAVKRGQKLAGPKAQTIVIGDTIHDVRCGKQAGAKTVGVCTGQTSREMLALENPDWLLGDLTEFNRVLQDCAPVGTTLGLSLQEGEDFYYDDGKMVLTEEHHLRRGYCCNKGCRHCPYDFSMGNS